jgi:hypothetical protein
MVFVRAVSKQRGGFDQKCKDLIFGSKTRVLKSRFGRKSTGFVHKVTAFARF